MVVEFESVELSDFLVGAGVGAFEVVVALTGAFVVVGVVDGPVHPQWTAW